MGSYEPKYLIDYLSARPSFWSGVGSLLDIGGTLVEFNRSPSPEIADHLAVCADWGLVGEDLRQSIQEFEAESTE